MIKKENLKLIMEQEYTGEDTWRATLAAYEDSNYFFLDVITNNIIGQATIIDDLFYMKIDCFELKKEFRNLGIGKECLKLIIDFIYSIGRKGLTGNSVQDAIGFWDRVGADIEFHEDCCNCILDCDKCQYYDIYEFNEFTLTVDSFNTYYYNK